MIKGLFETHLFVEDLKRSVDFYANKMDLVQCYFDHERRIAFFWIGTFKQAMLGLWEKPKEEIDIRHYAFECDPNQIQNESVKYLESRGITHWIFLNDGDEGPMVFVWIPAIAICFSDLDGHELEFIGILDGNPKSEKEKRVVNHEECLNIKNE